MRTSKDDNCLNSEHLTLGLKSNIELIVPAVTCCLPYPYTASFSKARKIVARKEYSLENISLYVLKHLGEEKALKYIVRHAHI